MSQTPNRFPGQIDAEGVIFDTAVVDPTAAGGMRYVSGDFLLKDSLGVFNPRSGSALPSTEIEIDFGALPTWGFETTVVDAAVSPTSSVLIWQSGATATGRVGNDAAWDQILLAANPGSGQFTLTAIPMPGPVVGKRKVLYRVF